MTDSDAFEKDGGKPEDDDDPKDGGLPNGDKPGI
jgi:hypothetical protein